MNHHNRRTFLKTSGMITGALYASPLLGSSISEEIILGHNGFTYKVDKKWGNLDPSKTPVNNCHEMVMDSKGRLYMITDDTTNNIIVYDQSGKLLDSWGNDLPGGHGLSIKDEGGEEFLYMTDPNLGKVFKTDLKGRKTLTLEHPSKYGAYTEDMSFKPTETAIAENGDIYVADGYGSQYVLQYNQKGEFLRKFGGPGNGDSEFSTVHGVAIDTRGAEPTLMCTSRGHNCFKRFTMDGNYLETIFLPGAFVCRPVFHGDEMYSGVCWSRLRYLNQTDNSGFVTILDKKNRVVSNPGGTKPTYKKGELQLMIQETPLFQHCHDVCIDQDKNIYVCQWNAGKSYPIKLTRV